MIKALLLAILIAGQGPVLAAEEEARAQAMMREVRCMVCAGESILDSSAPMARDMRVFVREQVAAGADNDAVRAALVERFGHEALLRPPMNAQTLILWIAPVLFVLLGGGLLFAAMRRRG